MTTLDDIIKSKLELAEKIIQLEKQLEEKNERIKELEEDRACIQFDFNLKCIEVIEKDKIIEKFNEKLKMSEGK